MLKIEYINAQYIYLLVVSLFSCHEKTTVALFFGRINTPLPRFQVVRAIWLLPM